MRKTLRNMMKKERGNNKIASIWRRYQENIYGYKEYWIMQTRNRKNGKRCKV